MDDLFGLGIPELIIILVIALIIFGPKKLPEIGQGLGKAIREFKKGAEDVKKEVETSTGLDEKSREELKESLSIDLNEEKKAKSVKTKTGNQKAS